MPAHWRRVTSRSVRVVSYGGLAPGDLLSLVATAPLVTATTWRPAADVYETATAIVLTMELAGVREDDVSIELYPDAVSVSGERPGLDGGPDAVFHTLQIRRGSFHLEVTLPAIVDLDGADATLENGILRITLAKQRQGPRDQRGGGTR
jgi:HSP20 family molecular chaperone IbpA